MAGEERTGTVNGDPTRPLAPRQIGQTRRKNRAPEAILLLSGGLDSSCLLAEALEGHEDQPGLSVAALFIDYGQPAAVQEQEAAAAIAHYYGVPFAATSSPRIPREKNGAFPGRNLLLTAIGAAYGIERGASLLLLATTAGDGERFHDARPSFLAAARQAIRLSEPRAPLLLTPYAEHWKPEIALTAGSLGVPLALTWSCWEGDAQPCGECHACILRRRALGDTLTRETDHDLPPGGRPQPPAAGAAEAIRLGTDVRRPAAAPGARRAVGAG